tara:strand:+ start:3273 stop:3755 length:483 start_codon:yes stop_codon:yes gene_type:complete
MFIIKNITPSIREKILKHIQDNSNTVHHRDNISDTSYYTNRNDKKLGKLFEKYLEPIIYEYIRAPFKMNTIWYQVYNKKSGSFHDFHTHKSKLCQISGIFYIKLNDDSVITEFVFGERCVTPDVSEGDIVLFDSGLEHRSPPNDSDNDKIILSFNLDLNI